MNFIHRPPGLIPPESRTPEQIKLLKATETLIHDLNVVGWDLPARLYFVQEDEHSPFMLAGLMPTHPVQDMQVGYDHGLRVDPKVLGIAVASEGYRHLTWDEVSERNPGMVAEIAEAARRDGLEVTDEQADEEAKKYYYDEVMAKLPSPNDMPDEMRVEIRTVSVVMRDGSLLTAGIARGEDEIMIDTYGPEALGEAGRVSSSAYQFMHGIRPDPDSDNPLQAVSDYLALKDLEESLKSDN